MGHSEVDDGQRRSSGLRGLPKLFQKMSKVAACFGGADVRIQGPTDGKVSRGVLGTPPFSSAAQPWAPAHSPAAALSGLCAGAHDCQRFRPASGQHALLSTALSSKASVPVPLGCLSACCDDHTFVLHVKEALTCLAGGPAYSGLCGGSACA